MTSPSTEAALARLEAYAGDMPEGALLWNELTGDYDYDDYCEDCARNQIVARGDQWRLDVADITSDSGRACEECGCTLDYILTSNGAWEELAHFAEYGLPDVTSRDVAFQVLRMFDGLDGTADSGSAALFAKAAAIVERAASAIPEEPHRTSEGAEMSACDEDLSIERGAKT